MRFRSHLAGQSNGDINFSTGGREVEGVGYDVPQNVRYPPPVHVNKRSLQCIRRSIILGVATSPWSGLNSVELIDTGKRWVVKGALLCPFHGVVEQVGLIGYVAVESHPIPPRLMGVKERGVLGKQSMAIRVGLSVEGGVTGQDSVIKLTVVQHIMM